MARARYTRGQWLLLLGILLSYGLAVVAIWTSPYEGPVGAGISPGLSQGRDPGAAKEPVGPRIELVGRVLLEPEPPVDEEGNVAPTSEVDRPSGDDLSPPDPANCHFAAWQSGRRVGVGSGCDANGNYAFRLDPGTHGAVAVEVLVSRRLRAVLEIEVPEDQSEDMPLELDPVALGFGYTVTGAVQDMRGDPVPNVIIEARPNPDLDEPEPWRAQTDAQGRFLFDTLPEGPLALRVAHKDFDVSVVETFAPEGEVLVVVSELIDLEGRVFAKGSDLEAAKVRIEGSALWPPVEFPVAADGTFRLERLPDGIYGLEIVLHGKDGAKASFPTENVTPDLKLDLALLDAHFVPVEVVDTEGAPIAGARVRIGYASVGMLHKFGSTDDAGTGRVGPVVTGPYVVSADADGYLPAVPVEVDVPYDGFAPDADPVQLVLAQPGVISGKVVDERGQPVAGAEVTVESDELFVVGDAQARARLFTAQSDGAKGTGSLGVTRGKVPDIPLAGETDEEAGVGVVITTDDGTFEIPDVIPGAYVLSARDGGHAGSPPTSLSIRSGEHKKGVVLKLRDGAPVTGRILDGNQQPVEYASISFDDGLMVHADERGAFDAGFHRGQVPMVIRADGFAPKRIVVPVGKDPRDVEVVLDAADGRLEGRLVDGNGQPVAGASVLIRPRDGLSPARMVETDDKGIWLAEGLVRGEVDIDVEHPDFTEFHFRRIATPELGPLEEQTMIEGWNLEVAVVEAYSGKAVPKATVRMDGTGGRTDKKGVLMFSGLVPGGPGGVVLIVEAAGYVSATVTIEAKRAVEGAQVSQVIELEQGGGMSGRVTDDVGNEVAGATVRIRAKGAKGRLLAETKTDRSGHWSLDGLPEGDVTVEVVPPPALAELVAPARMASDVLRGQVTSQVDVRFDRL